MRRNWPHFIWALVLIIMFILLFSEYHIKAIKLVDTNARLQTLSVFHLNLLKSYRISPESYLQSLNELREENPYFIIERYCSMVEKEMNKSTTTDIGASSEMPMSNEVLNPSSNNSETHYPSGDSFKSRADVDQVKGFR